MAFEWHSEKAKSSLEKHGVSFDEAATVFDDPLQIHYPDDPHSVGEQRFICLGVSAQGRFLKLAYTERTLGTVRIITAREMTARERKENESQSDLT